MRFRIPSTSGPPSAACWAGADERAQMIALIVLLADKGWDRGQIGRAVGLSRRGVGMALQRVRRGSTWASSLRVKSPSLV